MLCDRYDPINLFDLVPALSMALDPVLTHLDQLLDDDALFQAVKADLAKRHRRTLSDGRPATPVEVVLRMLIVKHLYGWSYEQVEQFVSDCLVLRQFCRVYVERVPDDTTLIRWANCLQPATMHNLLDHVVDLARQRKVTRGRKLRIDGTVVQTNIHHPTDSSLLNDGVRVLSRTIGRAQHLLQDGTRLAGAAFRDRTRSAKRYAKQSADAIRTRGEQAAATRQTAYRHLLRITTAIVDQARQVGRALQDQTTRAARTVVERLSQLLPRVVQVIDQTRRRVLHGEQVPAPEKIVSLFEPHTAIIRKDPRASHTAFGRLIFLDEVEGGLISRYAVLAGNPKEAGQVVPSVDHHLACFKKPPHLLAGDRGTHSATGERYAHSHGVRQVVIPKPGAKSARRLAHEAQRWFKRGRRWRAGIEGRISGLKRRHGLDRCRYHGDEGMERWVGWGLIAHDLLKIAQAMAH
jgi:IS5 family transposase